MKAAITMKRSLRLHPDDDSNDDDARGDNLLPYLGLDRGDLRYITLKPFHLKSI